MSLCSFWELKLSVSVFSLSSLCYLVLDPDRKIYQLSGEYKMHKPRLSTFHSCIWPTCKVHLYPSTLCVCANQTFAIFPYFGHFHFIMDFDRDIRQSCFRPVSPWHFISNLQPFYWFFPHFWVSSWWCIYWLSMNQREAILVLC